NKRLDSLALLWDGHKSSPIDAINKYSNTSNTSMDFVTRMTLWKYHFLNADIANRNYQSFFIQKYYEHYGKFLDTMNKFDSSFIKKQKIIADYQKEREFFNLIYPLAEALGITYIDPTDNKSTYAIQSEAYAKWSKEIKDTSAWESYTSFWEDFSAGYRSKLTTCDALEFVNSEAFLKKSDCGQAHIFDDLNNEDFKEYADIWYKRNGFIADNIIDVVNKKGVKKVVAFYGFMHIHPVKKHLEEKGYKVKLLAHLE
ncbi:MAG: DUF5694 domain-containing protein, partial [Bacteroidota bacterium]